MYTLHAHRRRSHLMEPARWRVIKDSFQEKVACGLMAKWVLGEVRYQGAKSLPGSGGLNMQLSTAGELDGRRTVGRVKAMVLECWLTIKVGANYWGPSTIHYGYYPYLSIESILILFILSLQLKKEQLEDSKELDPKATCLMNDIHTKKDSDPILSPKPILFLIWGLGFPGVLNGMFIYWRPWGDI